MFHLRSCFVYTLTLAPILILKCLLDATLHTLTSCSQWKCWQAKQHEGHAAWWGCFDKIKGKALAGSLRGMCICVAHATRMCVRVLLYLWVLVLLHSLQCTLLEFSPARSASPMPARPKSSLVELPPQYRASLNRRNPRLYGGIGWNISISVPKRQRRHFANLAAQRLNQEPQKQRTSSSGTELTF